MDSHFILSRNLRGPLWNQKGGNKKFNWKWKSDRNLMRSTTALDWWMKKLITVQEKENSTSID